MAKIKHKSFRLPEEVDEQLSIISVLVKKTHQELLREAVQDVIKKYQPQVQKKFSIQAG
jgi:predicted DNA-binding protein